MTLDSHLPLRDGVIFSLFTLRYDSRFSLPQQRWRYSLTLSHRNDSRFSLFPKEMTLDSHSSPTEMALDSHSSPTVMTLNSHCSPTEMNLEFRYPLFTHRYDTRFTLSPQRWLKFLTFPFTEMTLDSHFLIRPTEMTLDSYFSLAEMTLDSHCSPQRWL